MIETVIQEPPTRFTEFKVWISIQFQLGNIIELQGCKECNSTGLKHWFGTVCGLGTSGELCEVCNGTGIRKLELKSDSGLYICKKCHGYKYIMGRECKECKGRGFVDWLENIIDGGFDK